MASSNLWTMGPLTPQQLASGQYGGVSPALGASLPGMGGAMSGLPDLPPSLAMRMSKMGQSRVQNSPLAQTLMQTPLPQMPANMEQFAPTPLAKPKEFWEQQYQPTPGQVQNALENSYQQQQLPGVPGALPGQIPEGPLSQSLGQMPADGATGMPPQQGINPNMVPPVSDDPSKQNSAPQGLLTGLFSSSSPTRDDTLNQLYSMYSGMFPGGY